MMQALAAREPPSSVPTAGVEGAADVCVHELFQRQAALHPDSVAVVHADHSLTYAELDQRANRLAHSLRARGVGPEVFVGLCMERSPDLMVALLAILKSGAAFVPLDPTNPPDRLAYVLRDIGAPLVVTQLALMDRLPTGVASFLLDTASEELACRQSSAPEPLAVPGDLAYCIYTSGSTGAAKPVAVPHASIANHARHMARELCIEPRDRVLQFVSLGFDAALEEILPTWLSGATLVLLPERLQTTEEFLVFLAAQRISVVSLPVSYWQHWIEDLARARTPRLPSLRTVFVGGEKVAAEKLRRWMALPFSVGMEWIVDYGPTEATISCTTFRLGDAAWDENVPIGRAIDGVQVHVLDDRLQPAPTWAVGEIYIGGAGVARGYWQRPAMTAQSFVPDPFGAPGARMYRSGDLGRLRGDGQLEFVGRADDQVKILGHRIEPTEVEAALLACDEVASVAVVANQDPERGPRLVAYVVAAVAKDSTLESRLRAAVARQLPPAMVPAIFIFLEALPMSAQTGKLDRSRLPAPQASISDAPVIGLQQAASLEEVLKALWTEVTGRAPLSVDEDFFVSGGDSLAALRFLARLVVPGGITLSFAEFFSSRNLHSICALLLEKSTQADPTATREQHAAALATALKDSDVAPIVQPEDDAGDPPLASNAQQRLWFLSNAEPGQATYTVALAYHVRGALDWRRMDEALTLLVARHEALRTGLAMHGGHLLQKIAAAAPIRFECEVVGSIEEANQIAHVRAAEPFDLEAPRLLRALRFQVERSGEAMLVFLVHHAVCDAWSLGTMCRELAQFYAEGANACLPEAVQFTECARAQRRWLQSPAAATQREFWRQALEGDVPRVRLSARALSDSPSPRAGLQLPLALQPRIQQQVRELAERSGCTGFAVLLSAFLACLHRYSLQEDLIIGMPVACRTSRRTESAVGYFANTLALRSQLQPGRRFEGFLQDTIGQVNAALAHQELPFDEVVDLLGAARAPGENPLFDVMFVMQSTPVDVGLPLRGVECEEMRLHTGTSKFDMVCSLRATSGGLEGEIEFSRATFDSASAKRFTAAFEQLLAHALREPAVRVEALGLLDSDALVQRARLPNQAFERYEFQPLHVRIAAQAMRCPDAVAIEIGEQRISHGELDARANRLAHLLIGAGAGPERFVGVCMERSIDLVVGLLAVLKCGAAFIPMEPGLPAERLRGVCEDAQPVLLLTLRRHEQALQGLGATLLAVDDASGPVTSAAPVGSAVAARHAAYMYYTSGSTGTPKGAVIDQAGAMNRLEWLHRRYELRPGHRVLHKTPLIFDVAIWEIFGPLMAGAVVMMADPGAESDVAHLGALMSRPQCVFAHFVPSMLDAYLSATPPRDYPDLRWVQLSGEAVPPDLVRRFGEHFRCELHNMYGQTETSEVAAWERRPTDVAQFVPLGRQVGIYRLHVLDAEQNPIPVGVPGELCVAGVDGLARGYHRRPVLTAERFVPHPFAVQPGERLYRTGDLARQHEDGQFEYLGRLDTQTKIRGCRVEPGEVEVVLRRHAAVRACAVVARRDDAGQNRLVAYLVCDGDELASVAEHAQLALPRYMLPEAYVRLSKLPLTSSGKLDRQRLPAPHPTDFEARSGKRAPQPGLEQDLARIWQDILGLQTLGRDDNFFVIGGNSLKSIQVLARIRDAFQVEVPVRQFFGAPTVQGLAEVVKTLLEQWVLSLSEADVAQRLKNWEPIR